MYDAILLVSFGGPDKNEDVLPFLENVTRGRGVPRERLLEVAEHYYHFGGKSPINDQNRALIEALRTELTSHQIRLPIYWGNRNWHPLLSDTLRQMRAGGIRRALAFVTSAYSSYSGCRQYRENLAAAQIEVGEGAPEIDKLRVFYNHPGFIEACADRVREAIEQFSPDERAGLHFVASAHSIPCSMAASSAYETQLRETMRLVAEATGTENWQLVYQSRSGAPGQPWLGPDILDHLHALAQAGVNKLIVAPIGFISDHMEVLFDLDIEAQERARELGLRLVRAGTAGTHPAFVAAIRELIEERLSPDAQRRAIGRFGPGHDLCPRDCCPAPHRSTPGRPGTPAASEVPAVSQQP